MRKIAIYISIVVLAASTLASCSNNTAKDVASAWLNAFWHLDYDGARKLSTEDTKTLISTLQQFSKVISDSSKKEMKKITIKIKDVKEDGDKAVVTYTMSDMPEKDQVVNLVKTNGQWLVQFTKNDKLATGNVDTEEQASMSADTTAPSSNLSDSAAIDTGSTQGE